MSSFWNHNIGISIFGEAQGPAIGVTIDNLPPGEHIDTDELRDFLARRSLRKPDGTREDPDMPSIMSGVLHCRTTGSPLMALIRNTESTTTDFANMPRLARPGHADYTGTMRYRGFNDIRDDGHFSDKLTAPLVFAGGVCGQILERRSIYTGAHIASIHNIKDTLFNPCTVDRDQIVEIRHKKFPVINDRQGTRMRNDIAKAAACSDTLGGIIECAVTNIPAGIGSPMFDGLENTIAQIMFGIPGVKGIEFGSGFESARMLGSQNNDDYYVDEFGHVKTKTNNHGGILGGISSGMPLIFRAALRPNPSVALPSAGIDMSAMRDITIDGAEDSVTCDVVRMVPVVEAAANIAVLSHMLDYPNF